MIAYLKNYNNEKRRFSSHFRPNAQSDNNAYSHNCNDAQCFGRHFHTSRQAVSKHIKILTECELIKQEQIGREIYYKLEVDKMKVIDQWLEQFRKIWETKFNQLDELLLTIKNKK